MSEPSVRHQVFFMAGLARSGSTLLTSLLNQNPEVYCTPNTETPTLLRALDQMPYQFESTLIAGMDRHYRCLLRNSLQAMYQDVPEPIVIDKSRYWGMPYYHTLAAYAVDTPLIIFPVRPLAEIVASFIRKADAHPETNFIDRQMIADDFLPYYHKPLGDARVDFLLRSGGPLEAFILGLARAFHPETADSCLVVPYADLVTAPDKTLDGIYDFLDLPRYAHTFTEIESPREHDDTYLGIPDMHTVRPTLSITSPPPGEVLSEYGLERCLLEDFWTERLKDGVDVHG